MDHGSKRTRGFTLIELMIVVAIIGILAAIALPAFLTYTRRARSSETYSNLKAMHTAAASYYAREHTDPGLGAPNMGRCTVNGTGGTVPATAPAGDKVRADFESNGTFRALGFAVAEPVAFAYGVRSEGRCDRPPSTALYTYYANGDLNGDGTTSLIELAAGSNASNEFYRSPGFYIERELE